MSDGQNIASNACTSAVVRTLLLLLLLLPVLFLPNLEGHEVSLEPQTGGGCLSVRAWHGSAHDAACSVKDQVGSSDWQETWRELRHHGSGNRKPKQGQQRKHVNIGSQPLNLPTVPCSLEPWGLQVQSLGENWALCRGGAIQRFVREPLPRHHCACPGSWHNGLPTLNVLDRVKVRQRLGLREDKVELGRVGVAWGPRGGAIRNLLKKFRPCNASETARCHATLTRPCSSYTPSLTPEVPLPLPCLPCPNACSVYNWSSGCLQCPQSTKQATLMPES